MWLSRIQINNFRNFHKLDVCLGEHSVILGENKVGKSLDMINSEPKSIRWKMRAKLGNKKKWYREVSSYK